MKFTKNNICCSTWKKVGLRSKHGTPKYSIKIADKQTLAATCLNFLRFREGKNILLQVYSLDNLQRDIKSKTKQAAAIQKEFFQSCVKTCCV